MAKRTKEITAEELKGCVQEIFTANRGRLLTEQVSAWLTCMRVVECSDIELERTLFDLVDDGFISRDVDHSYSGMPTVSFKIRSPRLDPLEGDPPTFEGVQLTRIPPDPSLHF